MIAAYALRHGERIRAHLRLVFLPRQRCARPSSMPSSLSEKTFLLPSHRPKKGHKTKPVLVIHGGAGTMTREGSTPERQEIYKSVLRKALVTGYEVLRNGGEAMDAAVAAVGVMEGALAA